MRPDRVTLAAFVAVILIGGVVPLGVRVGSFELPPFWGASLRYAIAGAIFAGIAIALRIPFPRGANLAGALLMGFTYGISTALFYVGVSGSSASMGAMAGALTPLTTLAFAAAIGMERFTLRGLTGALVAAAGAAVIVGDQLGAAVPLPTVLALGGAMVFGAATSVVIQRLPPGRPFAANAVGNVFVIVILLGLSALTHESWALPSRPETWASLAWLILVGTVLLFPLVIFVIGRWTASAYSYSKLLVPVAAVAMAAVILGEPIRLTFLLGGALILVGVWVGALRGPKVPSRAPRPIAPEPPLVPAIVDVSVIG